MNKITLSLLACACVAPRALPAQDPTQDDLRKQVAAVIAVEEQKGDLAEAERLWRKMLDDANTTVPLRAFANQRLGALLQRLGRSEDAKPFLDAAQNASHILITPSVAQDPADRARETALGEQAKKIVAAVGFVSDEQRAELTWIGQPAIPAILAEVEAERARAKADLPTASEGRAERLIGVAWEIGGDKAAAYLRQKMGSETSAKWLVDEAHRLRSDEMLDVAEAFLLHPDIEAVLTLLKSPDRPTLQHRVRPEAMLAMAERGDAMRRALTLEWCKDRVLSAASSSRIATIAREGLRSTDPRLGYVASEALKAPCMQDSAAGLMLLADTLPSQLDLKLTLREPPPDVLVEGTEQLEPTVAATLWTALIRCANTLPNEHPSWTWVDTWIDRVVASSSAGVMDELLALQERRPSLWRAIARSLTKDNVVAALRRAKTGLQVKAYGLTSAMVNIELPEEAAAPLIAWFADELRDFDPRLWDPINATVLYALARTKSTDALPLLVESARKGNTVSVDALMLYAHLRRDDAAKAALREFTDEKRFGRATGTRLQLLSLGDEPTLQSLRGDEKEGELLFAHDPDGWRFVTRVFPGGRSAKGRASQPPGEQPTPQWRPMTPFEYLVRGDVDPKHPFSLAQVERALQQRAQQPNSHLHRLSPVQIHDAMSDEMVRLVARYEHGSFPTSSTESTTWARVCMNRLRAQAGKNGWTEWLESSLADDQQRYWVLTELTKDEVEARLAQIEGFVKDGKSSAAALDALLLAGREVDIEALLRSDDEDASRWAFRRVREGKAEASASAVLPLLQHHEVMTRRWAIAYFDRTLDAAAVPSLLQLLRDPSSDVREDASKALTRIRFCNEQEAHWRNVQIGIDASPQGAMEKLLQQARIDAPRDQRLLAIQSLGALGKAEALPFLIEWATDKDEAIAAAAKASVTQIHLAAKR